jgi:hypothetical protein
MADDHEVFNVRAALILGPFIGCKVIDITQHDPEQFPTTGAFVQLHFDNGGSITFPIGDAGFNIETPD